MLINHAILFIIIYIGFLFSIEIYVDKRQLNAVSGLQEHRRSPKRQHQECSLILQRSNCICNIIINSIQYL